MPPISLKSKLISEFPSSSTSIGKSISRNGLLPLLQLLSHRAVWVSSFLLMVGSLVQSLRVSSLATFDFKSVSFVLPEKDDELEQPQSVWSMRAGSKQFGWERNVTKYIFCTDGGRKMQPDWRLTCILKIRIRVNAKQSIPLNGPNDRTSSREMARKKMKLTIVDSCHVLMHETKNRKFIHALVVIGMRNIYKCEHDLPLVVAVSESNVLIAGSAETING